MYKTGFYISRLLRLSLLILCFGITLEGCATNPVASTTTAHVKPIYKATGYASFYGHGDGFNGHLMANGEVFHANNVHLAAHPSLPLGTKLKVTDLKNGKVLYVEVTDRMGKVHGRIIDLSYGASKYFGMRKSGLVKVKVRSISDTEYYYHVTT